jgi:hypothetical protein
MAYQNGHIDEGKVCEATKLVQHDLFASAELALPRSDSTRHVPRIQTIGEEHSVTQPFSVLAYDTIQYCPASSMPARPLAGDFYFRKL